MWEPPLPFLVSSLKEAVLGPFGGAPTAPTTPRRAPRNTGRTPTASTTLTAPHRLCKAHQPHRPRRPRRPRPQKAADLKKMRAQTLITPERAKYSGTGLEWPPSCERRSQVQRRQARGSASCAHTLEAFCPSSSSKARVFAEVTEARSKSRRVRCGWGRKHGDERALEETAAVYQH